MRRHIRKASTLVLLIGLLAMILTPIATADSGSQIWYLTSEGKPASAPLANDAPQEHVKDNLLHKDSRTGTGASFGLPSEEVAWFYSDTAANVGLSFGENSWNARIRIEGISGDEIGKHLTVEVCKLDGLTGDITVLASHSEALVAAASKHLWEITCEDNGTTTQDFNAGDWLAVKLSWDYAGDTLTIYCDDVEGSDSYIESPSVDPGYPTPNLSTLVLFSLGLTVLGGYIWSHRKHHLVTIN
ncbi:MAG: hypothetical protein PHV74_11150 [Dehalococcoidia bacterium]|nr:hypothetical protein [Dehalococcoidia bacterium]